MQKYLSHLTTTCILWHKDFDLILEPGINSNVLLHIDPKELTSSFAKDVYNFSKQDEFYNGNHVFYDDLIKKYIAAIADSNCEVSKRL